MNAIILAAGLGTRLRPLTDRCPKALVVTGNESFFSRQLRLLGEADVTDITVVTGYEAGAFEPWRAREGLRFVHNDHYHDRNNLHSMALVTADLSRDREGCLVLEGDVWPGERVLECAPLPTSAWFVGHRDDMHDEWVVRTGPGDRVERIDVASGAGWILTGMSYWSHDAAAILAVLIEEAASDPANDNLFWDEVPRRNLDRLDVRAHRISSEDWYEIDTLEDREALEAVVLAKALRPAKP
jgi:CTP:phosphocholine cytidylyltransferase-like protein